MSINFIDLIKNQFSESIISQTATQLGESESGISKAISALLPAVVGGFAKNNSHAELFSTIKEAASSGVLNNILSNDGNESIITKIQHLIFGDKDKLTNITNAISSFAGVKNESANSLLNLVTGTTAGTLGKYAVDHHLDEHSFKNFFSDKKELLTSLIPVGFSLGSLGLGNWFGTEEENRANLSSESSHRPLESEKPHVEVTRSGTTHEIVGNKHKESTSSHKVVEEKSEGGGGFWKWLLPLILLLLLGWFFWKQCDKKSNNVGNTGFVNGDADSTLITVEDSVAVLADTTKISAPKVEKVTGDIDLNGVVLKGFKGGMEENLINFLKSGDYKTTDDEKLKNTWYEFDNINFKIGSATQLEVGSQVQLDNLVAILKAFPDAKIKVGGYTDKTGNEANNLKLSQSRADYIKADLTKAGVGAQVVEAEGFGSKFADIPASASNEERAVDRKLAIRFTK